MIVEFNEAANEGRSNFAEQPSADARIGIDDAVGRPVDEHAAAFAQEVWRGGVQDSDIPPSPFTCHAEDSDEPLAVRLRVAAEQEADAFLHKLTHERSVAKDASARQARFAFANVFIRICVWTE